MKNKKEYNYKLDKFKIITALKDMQQKYLIINNVYSEDGEELNQESESDYGYQRAGLQWSDSNKADFILTILKGNPIPSIIIWDTEKIKKISEDSHSVLEVIDGQQRLKTLYDFKYKNMEIKPKKPEEFSEFFKDVKVLEFPNLKDEYNHFFNEYEISYIKLLGNKYNAIDSFVKINTKGKRLTPHEVREADNYDNGNNKKMIGLAKEVSDHIVDLKIVKNKDEARSSSIVRHFLFDIQRLSSSQNDTHFLKSGKSALDSIYNMPINENNFKELKNFLKEFAYIYKKIKKEHRKKITKMYLPAFYLIWKYNYINKKDLMAEDIDKFYSFVYQKTEDGENYKNNEQREKTIMRSSIEAKNKKRFVETYKEIINI